MEFRQIVHLVSRSTAMTAARPYILTGTRLAVQRHRQFSSSGRLLSSDETPVPEPSTLAAQSKPQSPSQSQSQAQSQIDQLRSSIPSINSLPPRPPPVRKTNFFLDSQPKKPIPTATTTQSQLQSSLFSSPSSPFDLVNQINSDMNSSTSSLTVWNEQDFLHKHNLKPYPEIRTRPPTGRTVPVDKGVDLARAFRLLGRLVQQNNVRRDLYQQREHERKALKIKRLRRERWRERFKNGFRAAIDRVLQLKAQGW
mgnify:CR=1 FL=1